MVAAASEQEQGNEAEITPAVTDPEQQLVEERDAMTHLDYSEEETQPDSEDVAAKIMESSQDLRAKISQLLGPAGSHGAVTTGDLRRRWLAFVDTELRFIEALLTTLKLNPREWENVSTRFRDILRDTLHEMGKLAPHTLQRAAQCFRRTNYHSMILQFHKIWKFTTLLIMHVRASDFPDGPSLLMKYGHAPDREPGDGPYCWSLFLYMSKFPDGYKFEKDRLIWKWIYESTDFANRTCLYYIKSQADRFFHQLVHSKVITWVTSNCKEKDDDAEACQWQLNPLSLQLLEPKFADNGFVFTTDTINVVAASASATDGGNETTSRMPRRLALYHPHPQLPSLLRTMDLSQTRSLAVSGTVSEIPLQRFVNLVVLDFEGWKNLKNEDLQQVCRSKMIFLRYLSVRNTGVSKLPHEIKDLLLLLTLDLSCTEITELPHELFQLRYLGHLDLRGTKIKHLPKQIVGLQNSLRDLLVGGEGTVNSVETAMPQDVVRLYNLETLATVDLTEHPASFVRALGDLRSLTVLAFTWSFHQSIDRDYCQALLSTITKLEYLVSLTIHCGLGCSMEFLGSLEYSCAPWQLEKFKVTAGRFASVPPWICWLEFLAFVQITICNKQTTTDDLKILGALHSLQCLILGLDFIPAQAIVIGNEGFRDLQRFSVHCVLPWLTFQTDALPRLTHLRLKFSSGPASEEPVPSGISNLRSIEEVALSYSKWCANSSSVKMTVKAVKEQVAKHDNPIKLCCIIINGIKDDDFQAVDEEAENAAGTSSSGTHAAPRDDARAVDEEATGVAQSEITEAES